MQTLSTELVTGSVPLALPATSLLSGAALAQLSGALCGGADWTGAAGGGGAGSGASAQAGCPSALHAPTRAARTQRRPPCGAKAAEFPRLRLQPQPWAPRLLRECARGRSGAALGRQSLYFCEARAGRRRAEEDRVQCGDTN